MKKILVLAVIAMLVLLSACGGNKIQAKPLSSRAPTAAATTPQPPAPAAPEPTSGKTAAEAIKELEIPPVVPKTSTVKQATTGLPPAPTGLTGEDALKARTKALYSTGSGVPGSLLTGGAITNLPNYHDESNLPEEYQRGGQYDD